MEGSITLSNNVKLRIDGHEITISLELYNKMKFTYIVYIDGWIKGEYLNKESELGKKFYNPRMMHFHKKSFITSMEKLLGKKEAKKKGYVYQKTLYAYSPSFDSFRSLKKVLSQNESIEIIS